MMPSFIPLQMWTFSSSFFVTSHATAVSEHVNQGALEVLISDFVSAATSERRTYGETVKIIQNHSVETRNCIKKTGVKFD